MGLLLQTAPNSTCAVGEGGPSVMLPCTSAGWKKQRLYNVGQFSYALPVPDFPDDAKAGVPFASKARQGSQVTFLMFDGSLQFLFTHFKITEGDHLFPSW